MHSHPGLIGHPTSDIGQSRKNVITFQITPFPDVILVACHFSSHTHWMDLSCEDFQMSEELKDFICMCSIRGAMFNYLFINVN